MTPNVRALEQWFVVRTKPKQESRAELNLQNWGLSVFAPKLLEPGGPGRSRPTIAPLFPGYVFARFNAMLLLAKVRNTRGVQGVVGFGEYATPVDERIIDLIRSRIAGDGFVHLAEPQPGECIHVVEGPLRSFAGVFERELHREQRVVILLNTMRGQVRVQLPKAAIRGMRMAAAG
jgi:transcriptional antiterminator RfaH